VRKTGRVRDVLGHSRFSSDSDFAQESREPESVCVFTQPGPIADLFEWPTRLRGQSHQARGE